MLNNKQPPTLFESNRRGPLMVHRQPPSWLELAGLACARSGPCEASTCLANQPFCMRNLMGSSNFIPFSSIFYRFPKSINIQSTQISMRPPISSTFTLRSFLHHYHPHLTMQSFPLPKSRVKDVMVSNLQASVRRGCLEPRLSIRKKTDRFKISAMQEAPLESDGL